MWCYSPRGALTFEKFNSTLRLYNVNNNILPRAGVAVARKKL